MRYHIHPYVFHYVIVGAVGDAVGDAVGIDMDGAVGNDIKIKI